jgi:hypothetical protein
MSSIKFRVGFKGEGTLGSLITTIQPNECSNYFENAGIRFYQNVKRTSR